MLVALRSDGGDPIRSNPPSILEKTERKEPQIEAALPPVTYVSSSPKPFQWFGALGQTIQNGLRRAMTPAAACLVASSILLSGCATTGASMRSVSVEAPTAVVQQQQRVDLDAALATLEARGNASHLATLLREKMADPKARADLASLDGIEQVLHLLQMEHHTKNFATPVIGVFIDQNVATQTEHGGRWDEDKNRAFTVHQLGPNNSIDMLLLCPVSGHAKDHYPDELYQRYTSYSTAPSSDQQRMRANAQIYAHNNSHYVYLAEDPSSYQMGRIVLADAKANGRHVTPVRVHLEGLQPGKTYEVRWSPFVGSDPNHPIVTYHGFRNGRSFRLIIPTNVAVLR